MDKEPFLVVDDEEKWLDVVANYLEGEGYRVIHAPDGQEALSRLRQYPEIGAVLLDWMMPGMSGLDVCRRIRTFFDVPILFLTAKSEEVDKLLGLELGADDDLTKPFSLGEMVARIRAVLRRTRKTAEDRVPGEVEGERLERGPAGDCAVWEEVARNPDVAVVDESLLNGFWEDRGEGMVPRKKPLTVGDDYPIVVEDRIAARKKIIAIAKKEKESYAYPASSGVWVKGKRNRKMARDGRAIQTSLLIRAKSEAVLKRLHKGVEKTFNLNNIFGLRNPRDDFLISNLFFLTFFSLFEGFSALATVIGIAGLMAVMFRVVRERRRQIGMLRAIGIPPQSVFRSILIEGALIAWTGIAVGIGIGCYSRYLMIRALSPEGSVAVHLPYGKLALYFGGALLITLLCVMIPPRKTIRLSLAEATRYVG